MKKIVVAMIAVMVMGISAMAQNKNEKVELLRDVVVNGTVVKKGSYNVVYDAATGEITIRKGSKIIAKSTARQESRDKKNENTEIIISKRDGNSVLRAIKFAGDSETLILAEGETTAVAPQ